MFVHVILVHMMKMAVVKIIHMAVMANRGVPAFQAMLMSVIGMLLGAGCHDCVLSSFRNLSGPGHDEAYQRYASGIRPLPSARKLLGWLTEAAIPWAIATGGWMETAAVNLAALDVELTKIPVITRDHVRYAKPDPDLFLAAAERLDAPIEGAVVIGDSIWDMIAAARCRALSVGLLSGGYSSDELRQAGALRVYEDPADLLNHIDHVGGRR
jgi:HAD superfamily hydrolase (TIGR01509 family)